MDGNEREFVERRASALLAEGSAVQASGDVGRALALFTRALDLCATADAHARRSWARARNGDYDGAILDCRAAIAFDPSLDGSYNDLGSYLIRVGRHDEGAEWLERAKRVGTSHLPYLNLARLYATRGEVHRALGEVTAALTLAPGEPTCLRLLDALEESLG